jgi:pyruvate/2-oxoglutarate/acetoin dehydrogenase E1 component
MPTVLESLNSALRQAFADCPNVYLLGEDILDPYGGAFKVTRGISSAYPERVFTTPVSEAGITGLAAGMALRGLRPVVEIMFGDFTTLIADQLINHITKFAFMYNEQVKVPIVIRTPMGGRRGYGPTHSQTMEKLYMGVPGFTILAPANLGDPGKLLYNSILLGDGPVLFIENKSLYTLPIYDPASLTEFDVFTTSVEYEKISAPTHLLSLRGAPAATLTLCAYGYMSDLARQAVLRLAYEYEIFAELWIPTLLAPFKLDPLTESLQRTRRLLTIEEGTYSLGWGAEVLARSLEVLGPTLQFADRVAAQDTPIPASRILEAGMLPGIDEIIQKSINIFQRR